MSDYDNEINLNPDDDRPKNKRNSNCHLIYDPDTTALWLWYEGKRYLLCQASGELIAIEGKSISDLYWSNPPDSAHVVRSIFNVMARSLEGKL